MVDPNLITTCNFNGQEFLFKMNVFGNTLEILLTEKNSGEEWQCSYDATYIENLTHKTGNFKQFNIFVTMIKSGLLRTSECVSLDLLSFEDLEMLRSRKITKFCGQNNTNKRYLIVTYCVEFDKIRYPLPLEYCGPPDPIILQGTVRRLQAELERTKEEIQKKPSHSDSKKIYVLQKRVDELLNENERLRDQNVRLKRELSQFTKIKEKPRNQVLCLQRAMEKLQKSVVNERNSHHELVEKLKSDKAQLLRELDQMKWSEKKLRTKLGKFASPVRSYQEHFATNSSPRKKESNTSINTVYRRDNLSGKEVKSKRTNSWSNSENPRLNRVSKKDTSKKKARSRSSSASSNVGYQNGQSRTQSPAASRVSRCSSTESRSSKNSFKLSKQKYSDPEFHKLEAKIESLQKMLKMNFAK